MDPEEITISFLAMNCPTIVKEMVEDKKSFIITKYGKPIAKLTPILPPPDDGPR